MKNNDKFDLTTRGDRDDFGFFSPFFDDFFGMPMIDRREANRFNQMMKTDVKEGEKDYTLEVELPGIDKKDVNLDLKDGYLTISAKRKQLNCIRKRAAALVLCLEMIRPSSWYSKQLHSSRQPLSRWLR